MRLWSIHPKYLDTKGLLAVWREGLLAKKVLEKKIQAYENHPQLIRFKNHKNPVKAINCYLNYIYIESKKRNYNFNKEKILPIKDQNIISVTKNQVKYEFQHLLNKLLNRDLKKYNELKKIKINEIEINPIFYIVEGEIESWEKI